MSGRLKVFAAPIAHPQLQQQYGYSQPLRCCFTAHHRTRPPATQLLTLAYAAPPEVAARGHPLVVVAVFPACMPCAHDFEGQDVQPLPLSRWRDAI